VKKKVLEFFEGKNRKLRMDDMVITSYKKMALHKEITIGKLYPSGFCCVRKRKLHFSFNATVFFRYVF
jgi:hypothetical protein